MKLEKLERILRLTDTTGCSSLFLQMRERDLASTDISHVEAVALEIAGVRDGGALAIDLVRGSRD